MNGAAVDEEYLVYLLVWLLAPVVLFVQQTRGRRQPGFLIYTYYLGFFTAHWFGAFAHASPWANFPSSENTVVGFRYSTWSLIALVIGSILMDALSGTARTRAMPQRERLTRLSGAERAAKWALAPAGVVAWVLTFTSVAQLPSMGAVLSVGKQCLLLATCLLCWIAWEKRWYLNFWLLLGLAMSFPIITVSTSGFISYGVAMSTTILAFVAAFYRPKFHLLLGLLALIYGGLCLWVSYAEKRSEIRESAWGEQNITKTFSMMVEVIGNVEPFDMSNQFHLYVLDTRLNQNELVGAAVQTTPHLVPFRYGQTLWMAVIAVIPRAIWPGKPEVGGSGNFVSDHTLIQFATGTSVGMGQVLEFYINFGLAGVLMGFLIMGGVLRYGDLVFTEALANADWQSIIKVFLIGSGLLQAGGSLMEVGAACATGYVLSLAQKYAFNVFRYQQGTRSR